MPKPKKWTDVYPQGTKEGDEEAAFFKVLARHPKWDYRSEAQIIAKSGLSRERVEEIIEKYATMDPPLIYPHVSNEGQWGYWERCPDRVPEDESDLSKTDKDGRIDDHLDISPSMVAPNGPAVDDDDLCDWIDDWILDV